MWIYVKMTLVSIFWAGTFIAGTNIGRENGPVDPFCGAFLRFAISSVPLLIFTWKKQGKLPRVEKSEILTIIVLAFSGIALYHFLFLKGLETIGSARASIIIAICPVFIAAASAYFFKEHLTIIKILGIILSVSGAVYVISDGNIKQIFSQGIGADELMIFGCVLCWAAYSLIGKAKMGKIDGLVMVCYSIVLGAVFLFIPAVFEGLFSSIGKYTMIDWVSISYLAIFGSVLGYVWYYDGIHKIGPTKTAQFINFIPVFTVVIAWLILKEPVKLSLIIGTVLVLAGVYLTNTKIKNRSSGEGL